MRPSGESLSAGDITVAELLAEAAQRFDRESIDDARLEADVLLSYALGVDRAHLLARLHELVVPSRRAAFEALLARRLRREPLAYITGVREFYAIPIACSPAALIPRPETELLVDVALAEIRRRGSARVADVGTGSGDVAIAIATNASRAEIRAIDSATEAVALATSNVRRAHAADRVKLCVGDLLEGDGVFDIIVANLPYVSEADWCRLTPEIRDHEPRQAIVGGVRGTEIIERLVEQAGEHLSPNGLLVVEIGDTQAVELLEFTARVFPHASRRVMKDLAGRDRALAVQL